MLRRTAAVLCTLLFFPFAQSSLASPPPLRIGVEYVPPAPAATDFRLYTPEGLDLILAEKIAARLRRRLELVQIDEAAETGPAEQGVDIALLKRPHQTSARGPTIIPTGFASGLSVSMRTDTDIRSWADLAGRTVCVSRGNRHAQALARRHGARLHVEEAPAKSLVLVRTGVCDAALHEDILLRGLFGEKGWQKFSQSLPPTPALELAALVDARNPELADAVRTGLAAEAPDWKELAQRWARNVAFEVYLDQDAPDCH